MSDTMMQDALLLHRRGVDLLRDENAALRAEIDRLRVRCRQIDDEAYDYAEQIEQLKAAAKDSERAERILAALRKPSEGVLAAVVGSIAIPGFHLVVQGVLQAAIAAAEQEVGRE